MNTSELTPAAVAAWIAHRWGMGPSDEAGVRRVLARMAANAAEAASHATVDALRGRGR